MENNKKTMEECNINMNRVIELYNYLGINQDYKSIVNDWEHNYLTNNNGRDGQEYYWYMDEHDCVAINVATGAIIKDNEEIEQLFS